MSANAVRALNTTIDTLWACVGEGACTDSSEEKSDSLRADTVKLGALPKCWGESRDSESGHAGKSGAPASAGVAPTEEGKEKFTA